MVLHRLEAQDVTGADVVCVHEHGGDAGQEHLVEDEQADDHPHHRVDALTGVVRYDIAKPTRECNLVSIHCGEILLFATISPNLRASGTLYQYIAERYCCSLRYRQTYARVQPCINTLRREIVVRYDIAKPTREWNLVSIHCGEILLFATISPNLRASATLYQYIAERYCCSLRYRQTYARVEPCINTLRRDIVVRYDIAKPTREWNLVSIHCGEILLFATISPNLRASATLYQYIAERYCCSLRYRQTYARVEPCINTLRRDIVVRYDIAKPTREWNLVSIHCGEILLFATISPNLRASATLYQYIAERYCCSLRYRQTYARVEPCINTLRRDIVVRYDIAKPTRECNLVSIHCGEILLFATISPNLRASGTLYQYIAERYCCSLRYRQTYARVEPCINTLRRDIVVRYDIAKPTRECNLVSIHCGEILLFATISPNLRASATLYQYIAERYCCSLRYRQTYARVQPCINTLRRDIVVRYDIAKPTRECNLVSIHCGEILLFATISPNLRASGTLYQYIAERYCCSLRYRQTYARVEPCINTLRRDIVVRYDIAKPTRECNLVSIHCGEILLFATISPNLRASATLYQYIAERYCCSLRYRQTYARVQPCINTLRRDIVVRYDIAKPTREWNLVSIHCGEILLFATISPNLRASATLYQYIAERYCCSLRYRQTYARVQPCINTLRRDIVVRYDIAKPTRECNLVSIHCGEILLFATISPNLRASATLYQYIAERYCCSLRYRQTYARVEPCINTLRRDIVVRCEWRTC